MPMDSKSSYRLAASITRAASKQTYYTIRFLVDRDRVPNAFRAYAYFRWVDDRLDRELTAGRDRIAFVERQWRLIDSCFRGEWPSDASPQERLLIDLVRSDGEQASGLQSYIRNMMTVMAIDAERRGRLIGQDELAHYTRCLAVAVTEALHYFIGHDQGSPPGEARYFAAAAAHVTHMLRDTLEDTTAGYFNIPRERLRPGAVLAPHPGSKVYREWVRDRVQLARSYFRIGRTYLQQVGSFRGRIAAYAYIARSEFVLDAIEREGFRLRPDYPERRRMAAGLRLTWLAITSALSRRPTQSTGRAVPAN